MGRLQLLSICAIVLYGSVVMAGLSIQQKELERAAELAVERAAEKAAERAVEKALNSGNSSTVTVTVKESYSNAMKTAEEQAAPGSESTRPYDAKIYDRQYAYRPPGPYGANDSAEAEELGISKESLNSSVEQAGAVNLDGPSSAEASAEADRSAETSSTPPEGSPLGPLDIGNLSGDPATSSISSVGFDVSTSSGVGFNAGDFSTLDTGLEDVSTSVVGGTEPGFKGDFGLKSHTKTFSSSYSKNKDEEFGTKVVDVDDEEDAEIFKMYATDFGDGGWTSAKEKGWVRHRPLWDDSKSRDRQDGRLDFWTEDFSDISAGETQNKDSQKVQPPLTPTSPSVQQPVDIIQPGQKMSQVVKRMVDHYSETNQKQVAVPLATLSLDPKTPAALYQLLQREVKLPLDGYNRRAPVPMKVYVTIPVPYLPAYGNPRSKKSENSEPSQSNSSSNGNSKNDQYNYSKETEPNNRYEVAVPSNPYNDEMNEEPYPTSTEPIKRSFQLNIQGESQEAKPEARKEKEDLPASAAAIRNKTLIIVPSFNSNSAEKRKKSEVAVGQPHPFQVNTPLKLFDPKRPETQVAA